MLWGAVSGAALVTLLQPILQTHLTALLGTAGNFESVVFGVVALVLFQFAADGLLPSLRRAIGGWAVTRRTVREPGYLVAGVPFRSGGPVLHVNGAGKSFGGLVANDDVTLSVQRGQIVALIGPNGAGKSTLFDLITGMTAADRGEFQLDEMSIAGRRPRDIAARGVGRSFQHVRLIHDISVIQNVAIGAYLRGRRGIFAALLRLNQAEEIAIFAEAMRQLQRVGLADFAWSDAGSLALCQQRILEIARALAGAPLLLLLDEPAAGLRHQEKQSLARVRSGGCGMKGSRCRWWNMIWILS